MISIVIPVFDNYEAVELTVSNIRDNKNLDIVIVDGSQNNRIKKIKGRNIQVISESDDGIYDAMNKGILKSKADNIFFLGAGDRILDQNVEEINRIVSTSKAALYVLPVKIDGKIKHYKNKGPLYHHQGCIFPRKALEDTNFYDLKYKFHSDFNTINKIVHKYGTGNIFFINKCICEFKKGGVSTNGKNVRDSYNEFKKIFDEFNVPFIKRVGVYARLIFYKCKGQT